MPPRRVVTPENLSLDFLVDLDREDGPVGLNLDPTHFRRDPGTGAIGMALLPPAGLDDLPDVDATLPTDGYFLAYDGAAEKWLQGVRRAVDRQGPRPNDWRCLPTAASMQWPAACVQAETTDPSRPRKPTESKW